MLELISSGDPFRVQAPGLSSKPLHNMALPIILASFSSCLLCSLKFFLNVPATIHYYSSWNLCSSMLYLLLKLSMTSEFSAQASFYLSLRQTSYGKTLLLSNMPPFLLIDNSSFYPIQWGRHSAVFRIVLPADATE